MRVLGLNAVFHDPAAAVVVDGKIAAAAEEERFTRRKHGKAPVPFSTWELPEHSARWCLEHTRLRAEDLDAIAYSYDPHLAPAESDDITAHAWEGLRTLFVKRAPRFIQTAFPTIDPAVVRYVPHHVAHAASAYLAAPFMSCAVMVLDGRGERSSYLGGVAAGGDFEPLASQPLPHSLGLLYEQATEHLGFKRSADEYKVMALASHGSPVLLDELRSLVTVRAEGAGYEVDPVPWDALAKRRSKGEPWTQEHADLAASVQTRLHEVLLDLARWLHARTGETRLAMAGGVALNCVANSFLHGEGPFEDIWVQPAAGDAGTALGAALYVARQHDVVEPMTTAALGRSWTDDELERNLTRARVAYTRPADIAATTARVLASNGTVGWFQGRSEFGPRALGHRSLLADPRDPANLDRLNDIKGREQFRPVAPVVRADAAADIFDGPVPSPYMLFTHAVDPEWRERIPAVVHIDGSARIQTVEQRAEPLLYRVLEEFERLTGVPVLVNTSLNTAGRPMVDSPRDALECFGSAPLDVLVLGPFMVRRSDAALDPGISG